MRCDAFDLVPLMGLRVDAGVRLVAVNAAARERFPFLAPGRLLLEAFGEHRLAERVQECLATGREERFQMRLFGAERRTFRVVVRPVPDADPAEALVFLTDLSEAVAYQELRSQFVANVSHELRTPITGLRGMLEALDDEEIDPETRRRFAGRAIAETQRLEALIEDILFLSEMEAERAVEDPPADLCAAARAAMAALQDLADRTAVHLESRLPPTPVPVPLNERMARTVVQNLVENAVKYAGPNATATVRILVDPDDGMAVLEVADDGPGIPERHLPHVFERFYRADPSRSKRLGGTGLGLSIVKHITERAGGRVTATSREGFGTTVTLRIPPSTLIPPSGPGAEPTDDPE